ncbi:unnamed protein product [Rotaria magnacalcarata]|uniref:Uncharacterized protein n=1 Tax=Rotaria magnacalcarata TaxID=392030 RepID=A0A816N0F8_9BILA|nr:unnamed protein product [Rotaria magnacalcarata]CAF3971649.1 unnamed protein product [Rotaria magnacalcarata]
MFRLNYVVLMFALTILPYGVDGFFSQNVMNITTTRNINCYLRADLTSTSFQFCAIRIYRNQSEIPDIASAVYNGLRYMNTMHQLTQKSCIATVPTSSVDTGAWSCEGKLPYETYTSVDLCICATDNCNQNLTFCQKSVTNTTNMPASTDFMPNLTSIISCNDATKENYTCSAHPYINVSLCQGYVINNTVLCAISTSGTTITQLSLIGENYEVYLSEKIYQANSIPTNATKTSSNETQTNFYFKYSYPATISYEECVCTSSFCNQNTGTCESQVASLLNTTTTSTTTTSATTTTATTTTTTTTTTATSTTTTTTTSATTTTATTGTGGEKGLGSAATAGLACGIIFSALIFTGEILFFKFIYSGGLGNTFGRSAAYAA